MARIRRRDTSPELALRRALHAHGTRFRVDFRIPGVGKVDIAFTRRRLAIFVDGCFWHCCPEHGVRPKSNMEFWREKLDGNRARDTKQVTALKSKGWSVIRVWEHEVETNLLSVTGTILEALKSSEEQHK
jgi:DNA mismatch endonuclease (patch repair protein)